MPQLGGQCLNFINHLENNLCWRLASQCRAWVLKNQPTQPDNHWVYEKTSESQWVKESSWGCLRVDSRIHPVLDERAERSALGTAGGACQRDSRDEQIKLHVQTLSSEKSLPVPLSLQRTIMENRRFFIKDILGILKQSQLGFDSLPCHSLFT